jgi:serine/threonine protein kinase
VVNRVVIGELDNSVQWHKLIFRYLILDVLGQGTFGQVVKCQNMRTHELFAVKVVKNKPAYLNQSKMEVAILELVCHSESLREDVLMYSSTQHTTLATSTTFYGCTPRSPTRAISAWSLNAYHRISTN